MEFQAEFGIQLGIPILMGIHLGECTLFSKGSASSSPGDPRLLTLNTGHVEFVKWGRVSDPWASESKDDFHVKDIWRNVFTHNLDQEYPVKF